MSTGSIVVDILTGLGTIIALVIGFINLKDRFENSYPWIDIKFKHFQEKWYEFNIINTGRTTAFDVKIIIRTNWGKYPNEISIEDIKPQQSILRKVAFPPEKEGGVYTVETITTCKRKILFKKIKVDERKATFDEFDKKPLFTYKPMVRVSKSENP